MGNKTGITWVWKNSEQKQADIKKYFVDSKIRILENKIKNIQKEIKDCEDKIGQLRRPVLQEEIVYSKNKAKEIKEEIKKVQGKIAYIKAKRKSRERRAENRIKECFEGFKETLLTFDEMIDIIRIGTISEDK